MAKFGKGKGKKTKKVESARSGPPPKPAAAAPPWRNPLLQAALLLIVCGAIYANAVNVPFYFDDIPYIVNNPAVADAGILFDYSRMATLAVPPDVKNNMVLRPVAYLTFALNHHLHGLATGGYHLFNIGIHLANALLCYVLFRLTRRIGISRAGASGQEDLWKATRFFPLFGALLFAAHPIQTQAVTYIAQRFTSLLALWYLAALVLYVASRLSPVAARRRILYALSVVSTVLAMKTKENAFTLPVALALYEWMFFTGSLRERVVRLLPYVATMPLIPYTVMRLASGEHPVAPALVDDPTNLVNFTNTSRWDYLMTQFGVIATYLRLLLLPVNQNLDHDYPLVHEFFTTGVILPLLLLVALFGGALFLWRRAARQEGPSGPLMRLMAFGVLWFFLTLSVESSLVPLEDVLVEHRVYLPSVGFFLCALAAVAFLGVRSPVVWPRLPAFSVAALVALVLLCSAATVARNAHWEDPVSFWEDVINKSPGKARPYGSLGLTLLGRKRYEEAAVHFKRALELSDDPKTRNNLAGTYLFLGLFDEARREIEAVLRVRPDDPAARLNLGTLLESEGRYEEAAEEFRNYLKTTEDALVRSKVRELSRE